MSKRSILLAGLKGAHEVKERADDVFEEVDRDIQNEFGDGTPVHEMDPEKIIKEGSITSVTDDGDLLIRYKAKTFTVTIDHPEL